ncbi:MAG: [Fe-Fe] hydrogenase large subunit C-terminal domain-containing protein [Armatimonadota bacterium]
MTAVIDTIQDRCKRCYTCVRNCPAKAIRVVEGQARVLEDRCIACGRCVRVCSQSAKRIESAVEEVLALLSGEDPVAACLAPSFPAAFPGVRPGQVVSAMRELGFALVMEVAFGAELVTREYAKLYAQSDGRPIISTPCPALVGYVEKHAPALLPYLAPVVSPGVALGRAIKEKIASGTKVVFIGPCIAKKAEIKEPEVAGAIDAVLTFHELEDMLKARGVQMSELEDSETDGPLPGVASIFPVSGGLLRSAGVVGDVLESEIVVADGVDRVLPLLSELESGNIRPRFLDLLLCNGCIDGPALDHGLSVFARREAVTEYVARRMASRTQEAVDADVQKYRPSSLARGYRNLKPNLPVPTEEEIRAILRRINKTKKEDELNCGACGYSTCREKAVAVYQGLAELQMCLPYLIEQLEVSNAALKEAEEQLIQSAKLASMGQLAAGIAHEINNPLGTVTLFAHLMMKSMPEDDPRRADLQMIVDEAARCKEIVAGLLDFSRRGKLKLRNTNINELLDEALASVEKKPEFDLVEVRKAYDPGLPDIQADASQLKQVFVNLMVNAAEAMPRGGTLTLSTRAGSDGGSVVVSVSDTGCGIPKENLDKLFTPFFTTKQIGKGTGLGLAVAYGIIKMHHGSIEVQSTVGKGTTFEITLPRVQPGRRPGIARDPGFVGAVGAGQGGVLDTALGTDASQSMGDVVL